MHLHLVTGEVVKSHHTAVLGQRINESLSNLALVEAISALIGDFLQRLCKIRVGDNVADLVGQAVLGPVDLLHLGEFSGLFVGVGNSVCAVLRNRKAFGRNTDRGRHDFLTAHRAVVLQQIEQTSHFAGNTRGKTAGAGVAVVLASLIDIEVERRCGGRDLTEVNEEILSVGGVDGRKTAAAKSRGEGLADAEGKAHGDGRVNGVAALAHDLGTDLRDFILGSRSHCLCAGRVAASGDAVAVSIDGLKAFHRVGRRQRGLVLLIIAGRRVIVFPAGNEREHHYRREKK